MPKIIEIEMDKSNFTSKPNSHLVTNGISTCIAFVIYASFFDEYDEFVCARGLFHWSGFNPGEKKPLEATNDMFINFLNTLREHFDLLPNAEIQINSLIFIGGEEAAWDGGELILSGTETEVMCLKEIAQNFDYRRYYFSKPHKIEHFHFLTSGDESLTISVTANQCLFKKELSYEDDYEDETPSPLLNTVLK